MTVASTVSLYGAEADTVARSLDGRQGRSPAMSWDDTLGNMETLDRWRAAIGLVYDAEKPDHPVRTLHGRPLTRRTSAPMTYASVPGAELPLSRLVMGCDNQPSTSHATAIFDEYFECGGNTFDTAHIYGGGEQERLLGWWMKHRGIRDLVAVISKGAHSPNCFPAKVSDQLRQSLDRLQTDRADVYFLHRDNLDVPVAEFIDVLNEHVEAGRIGAFGGSNWTAARIAEANAYAEQSGKRGFAAVSNNFSLARMIDPVWPGCIAASRSRRRWSAAVVSSTSLTKLWAALSHRQPQHPPRPTPMCCSAGFAAVALPSIIPPMAPSEVVIPMGACSASSLRWR